MYVFKGLGTTTRVDPWALQTSTVVDKLLSTVPKVTINRPDVPNPIVQVPGTAPGVMPTPGVVAPTPWYKSPLGIGGILLAAFIGYKLFAKGG